MTYINEPLHNKSRELLFFASSKDVIRPRQLCSDLADALAEPSLRLVQSHSCRIFDAAAQTFYSKSPKKFHKVMSSVPGRHLL